jgi:hypothetical protein
MDLSLLHLTSSWRTAHEEICAFVSWEGWLYRVFNLKVDHQQSREYITSDAICNASAGYDITLLHVQELTRLLQERGEPVLAICISCISRQ